MDVVDNIYNHLDVDNSVIGMVLQKAFDSINHEILLHKLSNYGIRGTVLQWFKNYLENRTQFVVVNGVPSNTLPIRYGVPQGSIRPTAVSSIYK